MHSDFVFLLLYILSNTVLVKCVERKQRAVGNIKAYILLEHLWLITSVLPGTEEDDVNSSL